jgi:hypothetical protein
LAVGAEGDADDISRMATEGAHGLAGGRISQAHGPVNMPTGHDIIRAESDRVARR